MKEINPLKTYNNFYTPKMISNFSEDIRTLPLGLSINNKILSQKGKIVPLKINSRNAKIPLSFNDKINKTPNRNKNNINKIPNIKENYMLNIALPNTLNNNNKFNLIKNQKENSSSSFIFSNNKLCLLNQLKNLNIMMQANNINKKLTNNFLNLNFYRKNNKNDIYSINNTKENIESVEWMIYNKHKNGNKNTNNINGLDELYKLQKFEEFFQMNNFIPKLIANNNYYNEFKKKHNKDYLLYRNQPKIKNRKSLEIKGNEEKDLLYENENNKLVKKKKLIKYNILSIPGSHHGKEKINQDYSFIIPKINECNNVKIFGVFDGHGPNGDKISQEICKYFEDYFNNEKLYEENLDILNIKENNSIPGSIENKKAKKNSKIRKFKYRNLYKSNIKDHFYNLNEKVISYLIISKNKLNHINFNNAHNSKHLTPKESNQN